MYGSHMAEKLRQRGSDKRKSATANRSSNDDASADFRRHSIHLKPDLNTACCDVLLPVVLRKISKQ
jgi:hypothetical protein